MSAIDASLRAAGVMRRGDYDYVIHPLMDGVPRTDPALLREWVAWAKTQAALRGCTLLLAPEAMGLPLAAALSLETGIPYVVARKRRYDLPGERLAAAATGYGSGTLHVNDVRAGDRVVIVDDVLSTGGTLKALVAAVAAAGATTQGALVFVDKATSAIDVGTPVVAMRRIRVESGRVRVL